MQKFDKVCVELKVGVIKRILRPEITDMNIKVGFIEQGGSRWFRPCDVVVLTPAQVAAVERRFGKDVWSGLIKEEKAW